MYFNHTSFNMLYISKFYPTPNTLQICLILSSLQHDLDDQIALVVLGLASHVERLNRGLEPLVSMCDQF